MGWKAAWYRLTTGRNGARSPSLLGRLNRWSVHAGLSFAGAAAIFFLTHNAVAATVALLMALLVSQSRVQAGIHSLVEVVAGALLGLLVTILVFQILG